MMTQDSPDLETMDAPVDEGRLRDLYEHVYKLESRVEVLEESNTSLEAENEELLQDNDTLKRKVSILEDETSDLSTRTEQNEDEVTSITESITALNARSDAIYNEIEQAQTDITEQSFHAESRLSDIIKRVAGIEGELGLEEWESTSSLGPNVCPLERFAAMPDAKRETELKTPVTRATQVWENFDDWSSPTHKGRVIRSGELRKLLKAAIGRKLAWTQVYRVMEEFDDNTTAQYKYLGKDGDGDAFGKALIRLRDFDERGEKLA